MESYHPEYFLSGKKNKYVIGFTFCNFLSNFDVNFIETYKIMKQVTLNIPDSNFKFFMELVRSLSFVKVTEKKEIKLTGEQKEFVSDLKKSLHQVDLHMQGKIKLKSAEELLDEL